VSRHRARATAIFVVGTAFAALSCQVILGLEEPVGVVRPEPADAREAAVTVVDPCAHAEPPLEPEMESDAGDGQDDFWFAVQQLTLPLKPDDAGVQPGLDLDQSCTCQEDLFDGAPSCTTPGKRPFCDFNNGVDDAFAKLAQDIPAASKFDINATVNKHLSEGTDGLLIYLSDYNGQENDPDVGVAFVPSGGLYSDLGCDGEPRNAGPPLESPHNAPGDRYQPVWDGCDRWSPHVGLVLGSNTTGRYPLTVNRAYVSHFTLVMKKVKEVALELYGAPMKVTEGSVVARIVPDNANVHRRFRIEGFIAGRLPFDDLSVALARTDVALPDGGREQFCNRTATWTIFASLLCGARDSMVSQTSDHTGQVCDAVTATVGFVALQSSISRQSEDFTNTLTAKPPCPNERIDCNVGK
jgi:hypothetical protein